MNHHKIHKHHCIHNNTFQPDSGVYAKVTDEEWSKSYSLEILAVRHLGHNKYLVVSIPHVVYGIQRYDTVVVDPKTETIVSIEHRTRNTSARIMFHPKLTIDERKDVIEELCKLDFVVDPYNADMIAVDLDVENSREAVKEELNKLMKNKKIKEWEYVVQDE